mgnify:CR=1 FL=1
MCRGDLRSTMVRRTGRGGVAGEVALLDAAECEVVAAGRWATARRNNPRGAGGTLADETVAEGGATSAA